MAERTPMVKVDGYWQELPAGDTTAGASGGGGDYLVWAGFLTQTGTDAPTAVIAKNTLGGTVVWTYDGTGEFTGTLAGAFTANKTSRHDGWCLGVGDGSVFEAYRNDSDTIRIRTWNAVADTLTDGLLSSTYIEIRVWT